MSCVFPITGNKISERDKQLKRGVLLFFFLCTRLGLTNLPYAIHLYPGCFNAACSIAKIVIEIMIADAEAEAFNQYRRRLKDQGIIDVSQCGKISFSLPLFKKSAGTYLPTLYFLCLRFMEPSASALLLFSNPYIINPLPAHSCCNTFALLFSFSVL